MRTGKGEGQEQLTRRCGPEQALDMSRQLDDVLWRTRPKDQAMARVHKGWVDARVLDAQQKRVDKHLVEGRVEELGPLLGIAQRAVRVVERLYFCLGGVRPGMDRRTGGEDVLGRRRRPRSAAGRGSHRAWSRHPSSPPTYSSRLRIRGPVPSSAVSCGLSDGKLFSRTELLRSS